MLFRKSWGLYSLTVLFVILVFYSYRSREVAEPHTPPFADFIQPPPESDERFDWKNRKQNFPLSSFIPLPTGIANPLPKIQHPFDSDFGASAEENIRRRDAIKATFTRAWEGYKNRAWMKDELMPISGGNRNHFGGWAATMIDSLDTLWILEMKVDFEQAVANIKDIDFTRTHQEEINVFETTIRYLGGLLAAYDLTEGAYPVLLEKSLELANFLYAAFDTPNRMPITRWHWQKAREGKPQEADSAVLVAEIGSLSLEFTRLSQVSGDPKFFDAIQRISDRFDKAQNSTKLPGLWPVVVNPRAEDLGANRGFSIGAMADSLYEYLPKEYILLGGKSPQFVKMYEEAISTAKQYLFFRPMTKANADILISGNIHVNSEMPDGHVSATPQPPDTINLDPQGQHLACFAGGMLALGSKVFARPDDLPIARKLVDGCIWAYHAMPCGIMPETFHVNPCESVTNCTWIEQDNIQNPQDFPDFVDIPDRRYILRPEAIESLFILYRITGDESLREEAWTMFTAIEKQTRTGYGNAALDDVTLDPAVMTDSMESFWTAETLKYFYLIFSAPRVVSLDEWVFNTEAHPFRRT